MNSKLFVDTFPLPLESPENIDKIVLDAYFGAQKFYFLKAAIELKIFDELLEKKTVEEISSKLKIDYVLTELILKALYKMNLLIFDEGTNSYKNTIASENYLKTDTDYSKVYSIIASLKNIERWTNLSETLKNECKNELVEGSFFPEIIKRMANDCKCWELQKTVEYISKLPEFKSAKKLLDVAGGHGLYAIGLSLINENLNAHVFDLPDVTVETNKFIEKYGAKNVETISGNFFKDEFNKDYDVIFSSYNPGGKNPEIAKKIYDSLKTGGIFVTKQAFPNESTKLSDILNNIEWNFNNFSNVKKGVSRYTFKGDLSFENYILYLKELGFEIIDVKNLSEVTEFSEDIYPNNIIIAKKIN
ncbi:conserved hypothetical protein [Methanococcus vannielii SB]|uniref:O-methyltransferase family 2 n=1 Tax=Methanococcus vannielii (strain ATCC 35089 / DSM 1224 / JCM 13029 / OCM 148 / SB) TaxID=406327 RepID=A6UPH8_METVS|nr:class I SAM-dependent methyltransferase [Methanococcus vannielii]ABR54400.1 conserved hypothetical protein [Methanococcus vannielii SB]